MPSRGVIYVATKLDRYVEEAFLSSESIKAVAPETSITLYTDRPDNTLCHAGVFDQVETISTEGGFRSVWAEGQLARLRCLPRTPYDFTLQLDTDTRVHSREISGLFDLCGEIDVAMVEDRPDYSVACQRSGLRMFNAGFILYRRSDRVWHWLDEWIRTTARNFQWAVAESLPVVPALTHIAEQDTVRHLLSMDQISLVEMLAPGINRFDLKLKELDRFWNYRGPLRVGDRARDIRILHSDDLKNTTRKDILSLAHTCASRDPPKSERLYDYIASLEQSPPPRASWFPWPRRSVPRPEWQTPGLKKADLHLRYGQIDAACALLVPENGPEVLTTLARAAAAIGQIPEAVGYAEQGAAGAPNSPYANAVLGQMLLKASRPTEAIPPLKIAMRRGQRQAAFWLGEAYFALKHYRRAVTMFKKAAGDGHFGAESNLIPALLGQRKYAAAVTKAETLLGKRPWWVPAIAFKIVALAEMGRPVDDLLDHEALLKTDTLPVPPGYKSLAAFNRALARELATHPSLVYEPPGHATRHGRHTGDLAASQLPALRALNQALLAVAQRRIANVPATSPHPFHHAVPRLYRLYSWAVIMDTEGHQTPHIHGTGWLSGVYYIEIPDDVNADDSMHSGWLEFGQAEGRWHHRAQLPQQLICPEPGLVVTFPSYFWHNTRPLKSSKRRISFAFDIIPA